MKYVDDFRDSHLAKGLLDKIKEYTIDMKPVKLMEVCGTHTMSIARFGIRRLLPEKIELISGPGCPVCVTPNRYLDHAIAIGRLKDVIITTFGDMVRVPGSSSSLEKERASGSNVKVVYSTMDALQIAQENPGKNVVFLGVGFETTAPTIAASIATAKDRGIGNFSVLCAHKTMPGPMELLASGEEVLLDGFICPAHVTAIIGAKSYVPLADNYGKACVVAGFEPVDILQGIYLLVKQVREKNPHVDNGYTRVATWEGNEDALNLMKKVFEPCDSEWRGIGTIPGSGLKIRSSYADQDAALRFDVKVEPTRENKGCICGAVMKGVRKPTECKLFGKVCTPENPVGSCMVSSEGTCAAYYKYDRYPEV